jgi:hypothetical protein
MRLGVTVSLAVALVAACADRPADTTPRVPVGAASPGSALAAPDASDGPLIPDEAFGPFVARLSEASGAFPSDNFVSNETSYLDVAPELSEPALRGRAYIGVGPEQNYTYIALLEPAVAYLVDLRRGNLLEHLVLRGCFEAGETRAAFLSALLARRPRAVGEAGGGSPVDGFAPLETAFRSVAPDRRMLEEGLARSRALVERLHVERLPGDDEAIARIHEAFFAGGLGLAYTMRNSGLPYPSFGAVLAERDPAGAHGSFLESEDTYQRVRRLVVANRVVPVVGDFAGRHALTAVAEDMRARGLLLGAFYASNVEQYLFEAHTYDAFVANVRAIPRDDASLLVRVWLDRLRPHPRQRPGHRTTSLAVGVTAFVDRAQAKPFRSYWDVVTSP